VTNLLFKEPGQTFGMDLASINMQRAREQGVPGYGRSAKGRVIYSKGLWHEMDWIFLPFMKKKNKPEIKYWLVFKTF